jgi:predicted acylesterase/phospholipase RssA
MEGRVIAVDLHQDVELTVPEPFAPDLSGWRLLANRIHPRRVTPQLPHAIEILMRAKEIGGMRAQRAALAAQPPDLLLTPPTGRVPSLDFSAAAPLVRIGREYARTMLGTGALAWTER